MFMKNLKKCLWKILRNSVQWTFSSKSPVMSNTYNSQQMVLNTLYVIIIYRIISYINLIITIYLYYFSYHYNISHCSLSNQKL